MSSTQQQPQTQQTNLQGRKDDKTLQESFGKQFSEPQQTQQNQQQWGAQQITDRQRLQQVLGQTFNITHPKYDIGHDVYALVNFSGPQIYKDFATKIQTHLRTHYPGMQVMLNRLPEKENMIDIRLRKGWSGGDEFIHYIENIEEKELEKRFEQEAGQIMNNINQDLINSGWEFKFQQEQPKKQLNLNLGKPTNITHPKLDIGLDVTCFVNYSGPQIYRFFATQVQQQLQNHFPGMQILCTRLPAKENMVDVRLRKGVTGGDEFIHYIENVQLNELESRLENEITQVWNKINQELNTLGFQMNFDVGQQQQQAQGKDTQQQQQLPQKIQLQQPQNQQNLKA